MMLAKDYLYNSIYKGALKAGSSERAAHQNAAIGVDEYKKSKFKKPLALIEHRINEAKRQTRAGIR